MKCACFCLSVWQTLSSLAIADDTVTHYVHTVGPIDGDKCLTIEECTQQPRKKYILRFFSYLRSTSCNNHYHSRFIRMKYDWFGKCNLKKIIHDKNSSIVFHCLPGIDKQFLLILWFPVQLSFGLPSGV